MERALIKRWRYFLWRVLKMVSTCPFFDEIFLSLLEDCWNMDRLRFAPIKFGPNHFQWVSTGWGRANRSWKAQTCHDESDSLPHTMFQGVGVFRTWKKVAMWSTSQNKMKSFCSLKRDLFKGTWIIFQLSIFSGCVGLQGLTRQPGSMKGKINSECHPLDCCEGHPPFESATPMQIYAKAGVFHLGWCTLTTKPPM